MFQLLCCQDKELRQKIQDFIINDLTRINEKAKNHKVNKFIRNKCCDNLLNPNVKAARKTLNIMILLFKKKIWNDDKTVNAIAQGCYSQDSKIAYATGKFFLSEYQEVEEESENNEINDLQHKYKLLGKGQNKKTKKRKEKIKTLIKAVERKEKRKSKEKENKDFMPIDLLNDPSNLCDKIFNRIKNIKNRKHFKLKIVLLRLIGRIAGRHKIIVNNFFNFCATLIRPRQEMLSTILASVVEAVHHMVSTVDIEPVLNELFYHFVSESYSADIITIGVNTLREIIERCHNCINYSQYCSVADLKKFKNKSVSTAVRGFINMVRDVNPDLMEDKINNSDYACTKITDQIEGIDLLKYHLGMSQDYKLEQDQLLTDNQLKKLRLLKLKENAEAVQRIKLKLSNSDINQMLGEKRSKSNDKKVDNITKVNSKSNKSMSNNKSKNDSLNLKENDENKDTFDDDNEEDEYNEDDEDEDLSECSDFNEDNEISEIEDDENLDDNECEEEDFEDCEDNEEGDEIDDDNDIDLDENSEEMAKHELDELLEDGSKDDKTISDDEEANSFVDENQLDTYKMTYKEKRDNIKNEEKEEFKINRKKKKAGMKTNIEARKNKPVQMVIHKIKKQKHKQSHDKGYANRIKNLKRQLGRFKRGNMILKKKGGDNTKTRQKLSKKNKNKV